MTQLSLKNDHLLTGRSDLLSLVYNTLLSESAKLKHLQQSQAMALKLFGCLVMGRFINFYAHNPITVISARSLSLTGLKVNQLLLSLPQN